MRCPHRQRNAAAKRLTTTATAAMAATAATKRLATTATAATAAVLGLACLVAQHGQAAARPTALADPPRVYSSQAHPYIARHELTLGAGVLPLDAFYVGAALQGSYTFHFSQTWAWEMVNVGYSFNIDTSLREDLLANFGVQPSSSPEPIRLYGSTGVVFKPLFGKFALLNRKMLQAETYLTLGAGPTLRGDFWRASVHLGAGIRVWSTTWLSVRFDVRDMLIFADGWAPRHGLICGLAGAYTTQPERSAGAPPAANAMEAN